MVKQKVDSRRMISSFIIFVVVLMLLRCTSLKNFASVEAKKYR